MSLRIIDTWLVMLVNHQGNSQRKRIIRQAYAYASRQKRPSSWPPTCHIKYYRLDRRLGIIIVLTRNQASSAQATHLALRLVVMRSMVHHSQRARVSQQRTTLSSHQLSGL